MKTRFYYGALRSLPLVEIVLGRSVGEIAATPDYLPDHIAVSGADAAHPMLVAKAGPRVEGLRIEDLGSEDIARLEHYLGEAEGPFVPMTLESGSVADVFLSVASPAQPDRSWDFAAWERDHSEMCCHAASEIMHYYGTRSREEVLPLLPMIHARATAKVNAARSRHGEGLLNGKVKTSSQTRVYSKFFALDEVLIQHERFDGSMSDTLDRAVFVPVDAVCVLPYDPVRDRVLLVEQFRMGPQVRGDRSVWQLELVAGRIDAGETPQSAALREAREEAGLEITAFHEIAQVYPSPGSSTEFYYIYLGLCDLSENAARIGGLETENEDIRAHVMSFDALMELCDTQRSANAAQTLAAYWLARHRERLRLAHGGDTS